MSATFWKVFELAISVWENILLLEFCMDFMQQKPKGKKGKILWGIAVLFGLIFPALEKYPALYDRWEMWITLIWLFVYLMVGTQGSVLRKVTAAVVARAVLMMVNTAILFGGSFILQESVASFIQDQDTVRIAIMLLSKISYFFVGKLLNSLLFERENLISWQWIVMGCNLVFSIIAGNTIILVVRDLPSVQMQEQKWILLCVCCIWLMCLIMYFIVQQMSKDNQTKLEYELMKEKDQEVSEMKEMMIEKTDRMERVLKQVVKVLASNTNYATLITGPTYHHNKVKFIQLSKLNEEQLLAVIVVEGNLVKNQIVNLDETIDDEQILKLNLLLNTQLNGLTIEEISLGMITKLKEQAGVHSGVVSTVLDAVADAIAVDDEEVPVYTSGATNIFKYPELADSSKASELISAFEDKQELVEMIKDTVSDSGENTGIQVYIGNESPIQTMKDCSVVTASYDLGEGMKGTIGIIGPKRMDYENVVDNLKTLKVQLDNIFKKP